ncbi:hypothetical protein SODALDRAFT_41696 [Sodiomyces alkalinus F11]|uniref:Uncharacterized protein n=1 Tax=Sodiomyces alkalinus (strain CBS 110278 / VKM F-3762 / F11) TaxID=1314773 RepID=A0A3N2Q9W9_SODAK|nr:hypothetical protein SODALDRAFT_41696 [Sodiomyces alkalinus F11]ROT43542.1 hypothetical protein SODALDRAFT_41696 [Sodiomyces alkalinus F11]
MEPYPKSDTAVEKLFRLYLFFSPNFFFLFSAVGFNPKTSNINHEAQRTSMSSPSRRKPNIIGWYFDVLWPPTTAPRLNRYSTNSKDRVSLLFHILS